MHLKLSTRVLMPALVVSAGTWFVCCLPEARNPPIIQSHRLETQLEVPARVEATLTRSCKDCHSNETRWPWYSHIPLASDIIQEDVKRARTHLNFSDWSAKVSMGQEEERGALIGICEEMRSGDMPLPRYRRLHSEARMTEAEIENVCAWTGQTAAALSQPVVTPEQRPRPSR
jgi:hypothetical protein